VDQDHQINIVHEYCVSQVDLISHSITHKFYENEYEKIFILGKMQAYENIVQLIEEFKTD